MGYDCAAPCITCAAQLAVQPRYAIRQIRESATFLFAMLWTKFGIEADATGVGKVIAASRYILPHRLHAVPSRMPQGKLRQLARDRIKNGLLVCEFRTRAWDRAHGSNVPCSLCEEVIDTCDLEYEVRSIEKGGTRTYRLHYFCYAIWIEECARDRDSDA